METNKIYNEDCLKGMKKIPDESVHLIITDPPFNIGKEYNSPYKDKTSKEKYIEWCKQWLSECIRILKKNGSLYLFNYPENNAYLMPFLDENLLFKRWMTWHYPTNTGHSKYNFTRTQHSILFYTKSKKSSECTFNKNGIAEPYRNPTDKRILERIKNGSKGKTPYDVFKFDYNGEDIIEMNIVKNVNKDKTEHVCQLPVKLIDIFVKASSNKGEIVFDPFMGSGTVAVSAKQNGRKYLGFELSPDYYRVILERLKKTVFEVKLTDFKN
jgi:site-specific DNA-methyltransferase (adenine-specific)